MTVWQGKPFSGVCTEVEGWKVTELWRLCSRELAGAGRHARLQQAACSGPWQKPAGWPPSPQVRAVCRRQFFIRALAPKIAAAQQEQREAARRGAPPAPPPHAQHAPQDVQRSLSAGRPVVLPQGDSWANAGIIASGGSGGGSSSGWYPAT